MITQEKCYSMFLNENNNKVKCCYINMLIIVSHFTCFVTSNRIIVMPSVKLGL